MSSRARTIGGARMQGLGLVEVLVAVLVLTIGLLGLAQLQITGLKSAHGAALRLEAVVLAYDVLERMRANLPAAQSGDYNIALGASPIPAQTDLAEWKSAIVAALPGGDGGVEMNGALVTVTVQWNEARDGGGKPGVVRLRTQL